MGPVKSAFPSSPRLRISRWYRAVLGQDRAFLADDQEHQPRVRHLCRRGNRFGHPFAREVLGDDQGDDGVGCQVKAVAHVQCRGRVAVRVEPRRVHRIEQRRQPVGGQVVMPADGLLHVLRKAQHHRRPGAGEQLALDGGEALPPAVQGVGRPGQAAGDGVGVLEVPRRHRLRRDPRVRVVDVAPPHRQHRVDDVVARPAPGARPANPGTARTGGAGSGRGGQRDLRHRIRHLREARSQQRDAVPAPRPGRRPGPAYTARPRRGRGRRGG